MAATLSAVANLLWPLIVVLVLLLFRRQVSRVIRSAERREFTVKVGGQELSMGELSKQQNLLIGDLQEQLAALQRRLDAVTNTAATNTAATNPPSERFDPPPPPPPPWPPMPSETGGAPEGSAPAASRPPVPASAQPMSRPRSVLWVDDQPEGNAILVELLQKNGVQVDIARSTAEGLRKLSRSAYRLVVTDMGRMEDNAYRPTAGLDFLVAARSIDNDVPAIVYSTGRAAELHRATALNAGAKVITASPTVVTDQFRLYGLL